MSGMMNRLMMVAPIPTITGGHGRGGVCDGICSACLRTSGKAFRSTKVGLGAADGESETEAGGGAMVFGPAASWWTCLANAAKLL